MKYSKFNKKVTLLFFALVAVLIAGILVFIMGHIQTKAEVRVEADPDSDVYVDGKLLGVTPQTFETDDMSPTIKIVPKNNSNYLPYETALSLTPQTKTIVRRKFNSVIVNSTTEILSFQKDTKNVSPMTIVTNPESAYVFINNEYVGTSPLRVQKPVSTYSVQVMHTGFQSMHLTLKNADSYNLTAYLDLAKQSLTIPVNVTQNNESRSVTITGTPTGYLRIHESPNESAAEISRTVVGREYPFEDYSPLHDWVEINLNASQSGWLLSRYATVSGAIR